MAAQAALVKPEKMENPLSSVRVSTKHRVFPTECGSISARWSDLCKKKYKVGQTQCALGVFIQKQLWA